MSRQARKERKLHLWRTLAVYRQVLRSRFQQIYGWAKADRWGA
jgi:hypothetical protein